MRHRRKSATSAGCALHNVQERQRDRLEEIADDLKQAHAILAERSKTYRKDRTPENLEPAKQAFQDVKDIEASQEWMRSEVRNGCEAKSGIKGGVEEEALWKP
jgi:hypothetical protein